MLKRKLSVKTLNEKCKALKDIEKGLSNKDASRKYGVQFRHGSKIKISISKLWKTIFPAKKRKLRESDFEKLDNVVFQWFLSKQSQNIPMDGNLLKEKSIPYAKELGCNNFHGSAGWLDQWQKK